MVECLRVFGHVGFFLRAAHTPGDTLMKDKPKCDRRQVVLVYSEIWRMMAVASRNTSIEQETTTEHSGKW